MWCGVGSPRRGRERVEVVGGGRGRTGDVCWVMVWGVRCMGSVMTLSMIRLRRADALGRGGGSDIVGW